MCGKEHGSTWLLICCWVTGPLGELEDVGDVLGEVLGDVLGELDDPLVLCRILRFRSAPTACTKAIKECNFVSNIRPLVDLHVCSTMDRCSCV